MNRRLAGREGMDYKMSEMEIIVHIYLLNNLPREYESVVEQVEGDLDNGLTVDLDKVRNKLRANFGRIKNNSFKSSIRITKGALFAGQEGFKGNCRKCGEYGHKATKCPKIREEFKCNYCKFKGHTEEFCRRKKRDEADEGVMEVVIAQTDPEEVFITLRKKRKRGTYHRPWKRRYLNKFILVI
jgi:hypothetical protein